MKQKQAVILGGGFGGISCAKSFARLYPHFDVTVIDQSANHVIHGNLYEVASSPEEIFDLKDLNQSVAVPYTKIFEGSRINFKQGKVVGIDAENNSVKLEHGSISYDYLISSLGAIPNYYGIEGAELYSIPLQRSSDALRIRDRIEFAVQSSRHDTQKDVVRFIVAGGGVAGIEVAAELQGMLDFVAWKNSYPREKIETVIIEGSGQLLPNFPARAVKDATARLESLGVKNITHRMISKVQSSMVEFSNGEKMEYDCLVWTAGVKACPLPMISSKPLVGRGDRVEVDEYFRVKNSKNIFAIGDQGCHHDKQGNPLPGNAAQAIDHGEYAAYAINKFSFNRQPRMHSCKTYPVLIPLGGKWAIFSGQRIYFKGIIGYFIREIVWLKYFASLIGWVQALKMLKHNEDIYSVNE